MASIDTITKRIAGAEAKIAKLDKKLERINKAEATGWEVNPYYYSEHDKKYTLRDLDDAKQALEKYKADLAAEQEKAASRNVPAILEFLDMWKARCTEFYGAGLRDYYADAARVRELARKCDDLRYGTPEYEAAYNEFHEANEAFYLARTGVWESWTEVRNGRKYSGKNKVEAGKYEYLEPYSHERTLEDAMARLKRDLDQEADRKYDFIIERTNKIVGKITDASMLEVGAKQDLNGYILGDKGRAKVQTIGAGGYNVQCFHFRTLINKA